MLNRMSIRLRLTVLSMLLLATCCVGLTIVLNVSANNMVNVIEASPIYPSTNVGEATPPDAASAPISMMPIAPSESSQSARKDFLNQSIFYMVLVVLAGGGLTYYISGKALLPLKELSEQMKNRTVHTLSEDFPVPQSHDELADLTCTFNEMTNKSDEAFAMQKRFSQSAAHELRTPLAVLKTKVDVFKKREEHTTGEYTQLLDVIFAHTNRLSTLVKDLLDLTNMDAVECDQMISVKGLLLEIVEELSPLAQERNIGIIICGDEQPLRGNKGLLHRAFYNIIENAVKYNCDNGSVKIALCVEAAHAIISISDSGIGAPKEMRELIFEPFFRVDKSRSRQMGGAGLGLPTVKAIIDKHHGSVTVSESPEGGTQFTLTL